MSLHRVGKILCHSMQEHIDATVICSCIEVWYLMHHCFCIIGAEIDQIKKNYVESQSRRNSKLKGLGDELHGVHKIMFDNIDAVLQRGELISGKLFMMLETRP